GPGLCPAGPPARPRPGPARLLVGRVVPVELGDWRRGRAVGDRAALQWAARLGPGRLRVRPGLRAHRRLGGDDLAAATTPARAPVGGVPSGRRGGAAG